MKTRAYLMHKNTKVFLQNHLVKLRKDLDRHISEMGDAANHNGDLRENFAFMAKEEDTHFTKARILDLKHILAASRIITPIKNAKKVELGTEFTIKFLQTGEQKTYILGGEQDAINFGNFYLNYKSPIAKKLKGKKEGEIVNNSVEIIKIY